MRTLEDAAKNQLRIHTENDAKPNWPHESEWRWRSLNPKFKLEDGVVVDATTGEECEFKGMWLLGGMVLLCEECYEDGT